MTQRKPPVKARDYLAWAKTQTAACCVCRARPGSQLHHIEVGGMGMKCPDFKVCRVCPECHREVQGKGRNACERLGMDGTWKDMVTDALDLVTDYMEGR